MKEINNTDAEGRLVLADGVAYASKELKPDVLLKYDELFDMNGTRYLCDKVVYVLVRTVVYCFCLVVFFTTYSYCTFYPLECVISFHRSMCTLTGAQGISTGRHHAGLVTDSDEWEL